MADAVRFVPLHAHGQRLHAAQDEPGVERREDRADGVLQEADLLADLVGVRDDGAADRIGMAVEELGGRVHDDVRAELDRALEVGRAEGVVDDDERSACCATSAQAAMSVTVIIGLVGVSRKTMLRVRLQRARARRRRPRCRRSVNCRPNFSQHPAEEAVRAAVHVLAGHDVIARLQHAEDGVGGGHAGGEAVAVLAALERGQVRFQRGARRVLRPRVLVALVPSELRLHVGRGLVDRDGDGAGLRLRLLAGVDAIGGKAISARLLGRLFFRHRE